MEKTPAAVLSAYDSTCYLCPGNSRAGGVRNPDYTGTFAFDNDFSALLPDPSTESHTDDSPLLRSEPERGLSRVAYFSPCSECTQFPSGGPSGLGMKMRHHTNFIPVSKIEA